MCIYCMSRGKKEGPCPLSLRSQAASPLTLPQDAGGLLFSLAFAVWRVTEHLQQAIKPPREVPSSTSITPVSSSANNSRHTNEEVDGPGKQKQVELNYAADRLLCLWLAAPKGDPPRYSNAPGPERDVATMLNTKHGKHYMVIDVSEQPARAVMEHAGKVLQLGWARGMAPPLEKLCAFCKHLDSWLAAHPSNVAVLRSCGNRDRLAVAVSAYLQYSSICGKQEQALDRWAMKKFLEGSSHLSPSDRRYVEYFAGLLAGGIKVNAQPLLLTHVTVVGAAPLSHVFLKLYEGMEPIYTSNVYSLGSGARQFTAALGAGPGGVAVRGDVVLRCYRRPPPPAAPHHTRSLIFSLQFHTCAVTDYTLVFTKQHLDYACKDDEFPLDGSVEVQIAGGRPAPAPTPAVRVRAADDVLSRWDSLQHLPHHHSNNNHPLGNNNTTVNNNNTIVSNNNSVNSHHTIKDHITIIHSNGHNHNNGSEDDEDLAAGGRSSGEGPIYATVSRRAAGNGSGSGGVVSSGCPGGTGSPLSASMDSGISSAGRRQGSPSPGARRRELDELLRDMMRTVEGLPGGGGGGGGSGGSGAAGEDIPYHARPDSRPFAYTAPPDAAMLRAQPHLSSPSLVRKALRPVPRENGHGTSNGDAFDRIFDTDPIDRIFTAEANDSFRKRERREALERTTSPLGSRSSRSTPVGNSTLPPPLSPVLPRKEQRLKREEQITTVTTTRLPHENLYSGVNDYATSPRSRNEGGAAYENDGLTWLQKQQMRLRAHKESRMRAARLQLERPLPNRTSASHRFDGYTSDTTAFADDDEDFSIPLHIQTLNSRSRISPIEPLLPNRTSSRKFMSIERRAMRERSVSPAGHDMLDSPRDATLLSQNGTMTREESLSSWRSVSVSEWENGGEGEDSRGATPAFPTTPRTPYPPSATPPPHNRLPPRSPVTQRKDFSTLVGRSPPSPIHHTSPTTPVSPELHDVSPEHIKFVRDTSKFWYKPHISRDEAIALLQNQEVGSFIIRDSNSFPNAFGLAVKVAAPPGGAAQPSDLVRHFLVEPTSKGVRLKGCADEPVFTSLSALVYQHSVTPLALPARLKLPGSDPAPPMPGGAARELLAAGAACNVLYIGGTGCEALTGPEAIARTVLKLFPQRPELKPAIVHFKVSAQGITLTDSARRIFFRRHYPTPSVSYCGLDPGDRRWSHTTDANGIPSSNKIFGFIARRPGSSTDNECHVFAELEPEQPATAIVNFVSKVMLGQSSANHII